MDTLAGELLEKETLHRPSWKAFADVEKRPRLTMLDDFGGRDPAGQTGPSRQSASSRSNAANLGPSRSLEPAFGRRLRRLPKLLRPPGPTRANRARKLTHSPVGAPTGPGDRQYGSTQPDYGALAGWACAGMVLRSSHRPSYSGEPAPTYPGQPYPTGQADPGSESSAEDDGVSRTGAGPRLTNGAFDARS